MPRDQRVYLTDIIEACDAIEVAPDAFNAITRARRIVDFRNQLTHEYPTVDNALVWVIAENDVAVLKRECIALLEGATVEGEGL